MNTNDDTVRDNLEDNVEKLLSRAEPSPTMSEEDKRRIVSALTGPRAKADTPVVHFIRKGQLMLTKNGKPWSIAAAVAAIVLFVSFFLSSNGGPVVRAGEIMRRLDEQLGEETRFDITVESLRVGTSTFTGTLQVSPRGAAGSIDYRYAFESIAAGAPALPGGMKLEPRPMSRTSAGAAVEAHVSFAVTDEFGWALIRDVTMPDAETQALVDEFFSTDGEVLIPLAAGAGHGTSLGFDTGELYRELKALRSQRVGELIRRLIDKQSEFDAAVEGQGDGTVLLTLPIDGRETLLRLSELSGEPATGTRISIQLPAEEGCDTDELERQARVMAGGEDVDIRIDESECTAEFEKSTGDANYWQEDMLVGSTLTAVYDPASARVMSLGLRNVGPAAGLVQVTLSEGDVAATLLDADAVTTPKTRVVDLGAFESFLAEVERVWDEID